jgi:hypothetical protein
MLMSVIARTVPEKFGGIATPYVAELTHVAVPKFR